MGDRARGYTINFSPPLPRAPLIQKSSGGPSCTMVPAPQDKRACVVKCHPKRVICTKSDQWFVANITKMIFTRCWVLLLKCPMVIKLADMHVSH